ncbi:MAG: S24/S26 family peptidase [Lachnospiraceae bacterium]|nr:S24/S26 family peptidase [Lachnospiraceae bacterium]
MDQTQASQEERKRVKIKVHADELLRQGKSVQLPIAGYSMYPLLMPERDKVILAPADHMPYRRGDVMLYRRDGGILVLHRIWKRKKDGYYMVGDNQKEIEGPLREDQMLGVMTGMIRSGREISCDHVGYRLYSVMWLMLRPIRPQLSHMVAASRRFWGK